MHPPHPLAIFCALDYFFSFAAIWNTHSQSDWVNNECIIIIEKLMILVSFKVASYGLEKGFLL